MDNRKTIITVVSVVLGLGIIYLIYRALSGGSSAAKKDALAKQKAAAEAKKALAKDPTNQQLIDAAKNAGQAAWDAVFKSKGGKNADGSVPTSGIAKSGVAMTTVDAAGDYVENGDPTTLYNKNGVVIGDLDAESGFYLDDNGKKIAASDGSPVTNTDAYNNYQDDQGDWYSADGTPIVIDPNGIYLEVDNNSDVFDMSGDVIGQQNGDGTYTNTYDGMDYILSTGKTIGKASEINSYNSDGLGSVDYTNGFSLLQDGTLNNESGTFVADGVKWYDVANDTPIYS